MKNIILIDIDSDRDNQIQFSKPSEFLPNEGENMVVMDIKTLTHGLGTFIKAAGDSGFVNTKAALDEAIKVLTLEYYPSEDNEEEETEVNEGLD